MVRGQFILGGFVLVGVTLGGLLLTSAAGQPSPTQGENLAPFVPTPMSVVERMLELAEIKRDDVVYDLGCGDGRIVVAAAEKYGARGVGVDYDPKRVQEAEARAREHKVNERVRIIEHDAMTVDISDATVVTLYLLPSSNRKLKPRLENRLPAGTRIISHDFRMDGWDPIREETVAEPGSYTHRIYVYRSPGGDALSGTWTWSFSRDGQTQEMSAHVREDGSHISGFVVGPGSEASLPIARAVQNDDRFEFRITRSSDSGPVELTFRGRLLHDRIEGRIEPSNGAGPWDWTARRQAVNVDGEWVWIASGANGREQGYRLALRRESSGITGTLTTHRQPRPIVETTLAGSRLEFGVAESDGGQPTRYRAFIEGDRMAIGPVKAESREPWAPNGQARCIRDDPSP